MPDREEVFDSPSSWVNEHVRGYVESDGERGHQWRGVNTLLLTTRGRKSAKLRRTALIYGRDGANHVIVASMGGAPKHPSWYLNLAANPEVQVQVGAEKFKARARTASAAEKPALWQTMTAAWPDYDAYQARTKRDIPVVLLERI